MANKPRQDYLFICINSEKFIKALHENGFSVRKLHDPDNLKGIGRCERTIRRALKDRRIPIVLLLNISEYTKIPIPDLIGDEFISSNYIRDRKYEIEDYIYMISGHKHVVDRIDDIVETD